MSKRLGNNKSFEKDTTPYVAFYRLKPAPAGSKGHPLEKVLKAGQVIEGKYLHTFIEQGKEGTDGEGLTFKKHLIRVKEGKITIQGCTSLNNALDGVQRDTPLRIEYKGKGKAKTGKKAPFLFNVDDVSDEQQEEEEATPEAEAEDVPEDEDQDEVTF